MHAPLGVPERRLVCAEFIDALEQCHSKGMLYKFIGGCNAEKKALSGCLRKERIDRTTRNREESKVRNAKKKEVWSSIDGNGSSASSAPSTPTS